MPEKVLQSGRLLVALQGRSGAAARALRARATKHCRRRDGFSEASRDARNAKTDPIRGVGAVDRALLTELRSATAFASRTAVSCSDLLGAEDDDRAAAAMFYFGYLAAKADIHVVDVSRISDNTAKVMQLCKAEPGMMVPQAFRQALRPQR